MKDHLLDMLFDLFEKGLNQLKKYHSDHTNPASDIIEVPITSQDRPYKRTKTEPSLRIISDLEQIKLTKSSYQFLMRMKLLGIIEAESFEHVMNLLQFSESRIVTLHETKWAIRKVLSEMLDKGEMDFLELIFHRENELQTLH